MTRKGQLPEWLKLTLEDLEYIDATTIGQDEDIPNFTLGGSMANFFKDPVQRIFEGNKTPEQLRQEKK